MYAKCQTNLCKTELIITIFFFHLLMIRDLDSNQISSFVAMCIFCNKRKGLFYLSGFYIRVWRGKNDYLSPCWKLYIPQWVSTIHYRLQLHFPPFLSCHRLHFHTQSSGIGFSHLTCSHPLVHQQNNHVNLLSSYQHTSTLPSYFEIPKHLWVSQRLSFEFGSYWSNWK